MAMDLDVLARRKERLQGEVDDFVVIREAQLKGLVETERALRAALERVTKVQLRGLVETERALRAARERLTEVQDEHDSVR